MQAFVRPRFGTRLGFPESTKNSAMRHCINWLAMAGSPCMVIDAGEHTLSN